MKRLDLLDPNWQDGKIGSFGSDLVIFYSEQGIKLPFKTPPYPNLVEFLIFNVFCSIVDLCFITFSPKLNHLVFNKGIFLLAQIEI